MAELAQGLVLGPVKDTDQELNNNRIKNTLDRLSKRVKRVSGVPGVTDDEQDGYENGMIWINSATNNVYCLADNTPGAAVWRLLN